MARRGRKPDPTPLKLLRGNPGRRALNIHEPKPERGAPAPPEWLDPIALEEWNRVVPILDKIGLLTKVDGFVLEAYCTCYAYWVKHELVLRPLCGKAGLVYLPAKDKKSTYMQVIPQVAIAHRYLVLARSFAAELGLSPSMRVKLTIPGGGRAPKDDEFEDWFETHGSRGGRV